MNLSAWSIKNPIPAVMLFVMLSFAGMLAFKSMKVQQFPDLELPTVTVAAVLPGAAPAQLETEVARKLENAIAPLQGLKNIYTKVQDGGVTVTAEFRLEKPTQEAVDDVRSAVQGVRSDLPSDVRDPVVSKVNLSGAPILAFTIRSAQMDDEALSWFVDNTIARRLLGVKGVGSVVRVGGVTRQVEVALDPLKLQALGATAADVSRQLRQVQTESAGGRGDLRVYGLVQFLPMLLIPLMLLVSPGQGLRSSWLWATLAIYGLSKVTEYFDHGILESTGLLSGHTIKHLLASLAVHCAVLAMLRTRPSPAA
jgi:multidrug efflux pump subunit AcrB